MDLPELEQNQSHKYEYSKMVPLFLRDHFAICMQVIAYDRRAFFDLSDIAVYPSAAIFFFQWR